MMKKPQEETSRLTADKKEEHTEELNTTDTKKPSGEEKVIADILRYKDLLDSGIITQEEFDAKKKQLLGL